MLRNLVLSLVCVFGLGFAMAEASPPRLIGQKFVPRVQPLPPMHHHHHHFNNQRILVRPYPGFYYSSPYYYYPIPYYYDPYAPYLPW